MHLKVKGKIQEYRWRQTCFGRPWRHSPNVVHPVCGSAFNLPGTKADRIDNFDRLMDEAIQKQSGTTPVFGLHEGYPSAPYTSQVEFWVRRLSRMEDFTSELYFAHAKVLEKGASDVEWLKATGRAHRECLLWKWAGFLGGNIPHVVGPTCKAVS
jgi:hypothetical protein